LLTDIENSVTSQNQFLQIKCKLGLNNLNPLADVMIVVLVYIADGLLSNSLLKVAQQHFVM